MKKLTKRTLTRKLDALCSRIVRAQGICARCRTTKYEQLQCCHIFSRKYRSVRWDFDNMLCLCVSCHFWAHHNPVLFAEFVKEYLGHKYRTLKQQARSIKKWTLEEMIGYYEELKHRFTKPQCE